MATGGTPEGRGRDLTSRAIAARGAPDSPVANLSSLPLFRGTDFDPNRDSQRLSTQHSRARSAALSWPVPGWFTMSELAEKTGDPAASVERQIRYLRSKKFGGYTVEKEHVSGGTFRYRVRPDNG